MRRTVRRKGMYFLLNKEADFNKGFGDKTEISGGGIMLREGSTEGVYYTKIFDSGERLMSWHRLKIEGEALKEAWWSVTVYAADSLHLSHKEKDVREIIADDGLLQEQKDELLKEFKKAEFDRGWDALLFETEGRYLWLKMTLMAQGGQKPLIRRVQVYFPKDTWLSRLPEIYAEEKKSAFFLERFLGIFQSLYEDMSEKIEKIPELLEPEAGDGACLADWLAVENQKLWSGEQLLYLIKNAVRLYEGRGTPACIKELIQLYTGREPFLVEYHMIQPYFDGGETERMLRELYTPNPWEFAVLTEGEEMGEENRLSALEQIADMAKPAYMGCRLVVLRPYLFLNRHSYLGINSVLGRYKELRLDGLCAVPFSVLAEEKGGGKA